ncbi:hypothetical protein ACFXK0_11225 [Nocardia sp. NPDC059177]|uniref:hypothetical protein n=1 Tax=Nocardia sp. NPDC059177 TaxID=3346759 RepID=UPI0036B0D2D4
MDRESDRPVELGKARVQDAPEPEAAVPEPPAIPELQAAVPEPPVVPEPEAAVAELPVVPEPPAASGPPPAVWADQPWAGIESPSAQLPPYPPPPPVAQPMFPAPGYPRAAYGVPPYAPPQQLPPGYGYVDTTPIYSILSFCCVGASVLGGAMLCGFPLLLTVPTGVVLGIVGHTKGEQMGKWAAIANGALGALAALAVVVLLALLGTA